MVLEISDVIYLMDPYIYMYIYISNKEKIVKPSFYGDVMGIELTDTMCIFMY